MTDEIKLRKTDEEAPKKLPRGVKLMVLGDRAMFVRSYMGKLFPVPEDEQERLRREYVN